MKYKYLKLVLFVTDSGIPLTFSAGGQLALADKTL